MTIDCHFVQEMLDLSIQSSQKLSQESIRLKFAIGAAAYVTAPHEAERSSCRLLPNQRHALFRFSFRQTVSFGASP